MRQHVDPIKLSQEQVLHYHREGFLRLDRITTDEDVASMRELYEGLFERFDELPKDLAFDLGDEKLHNGVQRSPQINVASRFEPRLKDTLYWKRALSVARQLLGAEATGPTFDHAIYKPPHNQAATPWHQDIAYGGDPGTIFFAANIWLPLQDATIENGCMQFIPRSHLGNFLPHHPVGHDPKWHTLETDEYDDSLAVPCPVPAGGCTIHHPKTLHYTGPNRADTPRMAWTLCFRGPQPKQVEQA